MEIGNNSQQWRFESANSAWTGVAEQAGEAGKFCVGRCCQFCQPKRDVPGLESRVDQTQLDASSDSSLYAQNLEKKVIKKSM